MLFRSDQGFDHGLGMANEPWISALNWPPDLRPAVIEHLDCCLDLDLDSRLAKSVQAIRASLQAHEFNAQQWQRSEQYRTLLDQIRGEDSSVLMPTRARSS